MSISVDRYKTSDEAAWADVLKDSKNGLFLFDRRYMEYHADRFTDASFVIRSDNKPVALLPACIDAHMDVVSHAGLTFGGFVFRKDLRFDVAAQVIEETVAAIRALGARSIKMKLVPESFWSYPAGETSYVLWKNGFVLEAKELSSIIPLSHRIGVNRSKQQSIQKAHRDGVAYGPCSIAEFHALLTDVLVAQHGVKPVHTREELELLVSRFPHNIFVRSAWCEQELAAGTLIFDYGSVWHTQYMAASNIGRKSGALDLVISNVILEASEKGVQKLSFGTSTERGGRELNHGLLWQKESYGARSITYDTLKITF